MAGPSWPDEGVKRFIPPVGTIELSTVFLSAMWLIRETGHDKTKLFRVKICHHACIGVHSTPAHDASLVLNLTEFGCRLCLGCLDQVSLRLGLSH